MHKKNGKCNLCSILGKFSRAMGFTLVIHEGGRKGLWCGSFALFLVRFCDNFYFKTRYCGFKTLSGLRLLQPLSCSVQ